MARTTKVGVAYMKSWERENWIRRKGREEGRAEGEEIGLQKGEKIGIRKGISTLIETCRELGVSFDDTLRRLQEKLSLDEEEAKQSMKRYW